MDIVQVCCIFSLLAIGYKHLPRNAVFLTIPIFVYTRKLFLQLATQICTVILVHYVACYDSSRFSSVVLINVYDDHDLEGKRGNHSEKSEMVICSLAR